MQHPALNAQPPWRLRIRSCHFNGINVLPIPLQYSQNIQLDRPQFGVPHLVDRSPAVVVAMVLPTYYTYCYQAAAFTGSLRGMPQWYSIASYLI